MVEQHPFKPFIPFNSKILILGSFPCLKNGSYGEWYYCGSGRNHLWLILETIYAVSLENIEAKMLFCEQYYIAMADIIKQAERTKGSCSDANLLVKEYNIEGIKECLIAGVKKILFTSKFVEAKFNLIKDQLNLDGVEAMALLSPSPAANRYIASLLPYKKLKESGAVNNALEYKVMNFREHLVDSN